MTTCIDLIYSYIDGLLEILIQFIFLHQYLDKRGTPGQLVFFILTGGVLVSLPLPILPKLILFAALLILYIVRIQKRRMLSAVTFALLTITVMQLCYGILDSVSTVSASLLSRLQLPLPGRFFMITGSLLSLTLSFLCYLLLYQYKKRQRDIHQHILLTAGPLLTAFTVSFYISFTFYGNTASPEPLSTPLLRNQSQMFLIQILSVLSLFTILYACQRLAESHSLQEKLALLTQQFHIQEQYAAKARAHYIGTRSLRHDMQNHILVIKGLLEKENFARAKTYLEDMSAAAEALSFSFHTGSPVLDILLENKTALAESRGISVSSSLDIPFPCAIDDMDFCSILSNALDNAIHACEKLDSAEKREIHIAGSRQENLLLLEIRNNCRQSSRFRRGMGLSNIRKTAEKYNGTVKIHTDNGLFHLSILLIIPQHPQGISHQIR